MNKRWFVFALSSLVATHCSGPVSGDDGEASSDATIDHAPHMDTSVDDRVEHDRASIDDVMDADTTNDATLDSVAPRDALADVRTSDARTDGGAESGADAGLTLNNPPTCMAANVTAAMLYTGVVSISCTGARCHDPGSAGTLAMGSVAQMRTNLLIPSRSGMPRVTARDLDRSYVMYKLLNQHPRVPGGAGTRMPPSASLSNAQLCLFVNWIRSGAL
jgi:hypothetical protein